MVKEFGRLASLYINGGISRHPVESTVIGEPQKVLGIPGFNSTKAHLGLVGEAIRQRLPQGSEVVLYKPSTVANYGLIDGGRYGIPSNFLTDWANLRKIEVMRIGDTAKRLADEQGKPIQVFGHSLGGVLVLEAWLENLDSIDTLATAGSPHQVPGISIYERPDKGNLYSIAGKRDLVVPWPLAIHDGSDSVTKVSRGHFALLTRREGITAIANAVTGTVPSQQPLEYLQRAS